MKKFWQTSEFWVTLVTNLSGMAVLMGAITSEQADQLKNAVQQIVGGVMSLVPLIMYVKSRTDLKAAVVASMPPAAQANATAHAEALKAAGV